MHSRLRAICALLSALFLVLVFFLPRGHAANTITVTNAGDGAANAANCPGTGASCRLRDAIAAAAAGDTINFSNSTANGAVNFFDGNPHTITLSSGGLALGSDLTINGPGANALKIDANFASRVFTINAGTIAISGLTIANGRITGGSTNQGGGIFNAGTVTLTDCTLSSNSLSGGTSNAGGGILNQGALTLTNCTLSGNFIDSGTSNFGGGIYNSGTLTLTNSTLSGSTALVGNNAGAGIYNGISGTVTLTNCTLSDNIAGGGGSNNNGGAISNQLGGTVNARNTIIAGNSAPTGRDVSGTLTSQGHNLIGVGSGVTVTPATGDQIGTLVSPINPTLFPLANNGGPTQTRALGVGSPAIDAGDDCVVDNTCLPALGAALTTEQRGSGFARKVGAHVDIGAFEVHAITLTVDNNGDDGAKSACTASANDCSLRGAIFRANTADIYVINFDPAVFNAAQIITLSGSELTIGNVTINGPGANLLTVDANQASRVFKVKVDFPAAISGLTIANGKVTGSETGGGIYNDHGTVTLTNCTLSGNSAIGLNPGLDSPAGGGISNNGGTVTLTNCVLTSNSVSGGAFADGGGIFNRNGGTLTLINSTLSGNSVNFGTNNEGGGISNLVGAMTLTNCTLSGNSVNGSASSGVRGGGINNQGSVTLTNSTLSGNSVSTSGLSQPVGGGIYNGTSGALVMVRNTIIAQNTATSGPDVRGGLNASSSFNLIGDGTDMTGISNGSNGNQVGSPGSPINSLLGPLANNGGPTMTRLLLPGSPAINAGDPAFGPPPATDQRGLNRVIAGRLDIGAVELNFAISATAGTPQSAPINSAFATLLKATVTDESGNLTSGIPVTFTAPASGPSGTFTGGVTTAIVNTDGGGVATAPAFTANATVGGPYNVNATVNGITPAALFSLTNNKAATAAAVVSSVNPSDFGQSVTFTATVTSGAGTPTGTVQFKDNGANLGVPVALNPSGVAQFTTTTLTGGAHTIAADYSGDTNFLTSTGTLSGGQAVKPSISINDISISEGDSGTKVLNFTVTLSAASNLTVTLNYATANGTATAGSDYVSIPSTLLTFNPSETTKTIPVTINGDVNVEPDETFTVNLSNPTNATISKATGTGTIQNDDVAGGLMSVSRPTYTLNVSGSLGTLTVVRSNNTSQAVTVDYATDDTGSSTNCGASNTGLASQRCDYTSMFGTLKFAANETQQTIDIPINLDGFTEGPEVFKLNLSNPTGGAVLIAPSSATVTINDSASPLPNAIDDTTDFVRQQYHDFLNRDADPAGLAFWKDNIDKCNDPARRPVGQTLIQCFEIQQITTSASFFLSIEFRQTGGLVRDFYVASLNRPLTNNMPDYVEFMRDTQAIQRGVVVGQGNWQAQLAANQLAFINQFVVQAEFMGLYPTTDTPAQYVDKLYLHANVTPANAAERAAAIAEFGGAATAADPAARGRALLRITQNAAFQARELNRGFVQMEYFGYLRRNPNDAPDGNFNGDNFWLNKLIQFNGDFLQAEMVKAFLTSLEYRKRFGP